MLANTIAQEVQHECEAIAAMPFSNAQELVQSRIKMGLSQNIANVTAHTTELANTLGVPPSIPFPGAPPVPGGKEAQRHCGGGRETGWRRIPAGDADDEPDGLHGGTAPVRC